MGTKGKPVGVYVPPEVDLSLHVLSLRLKKEAGIAINKSRLYELGARLLLALVKAGENAEDCLLAVYKYDKELAEALADIIELNEKAEPVRG